MNVVLISNLNQLNIYRESVTSRSCEDEESATEEGSSDPQLGWTFYDRVVVSFNSCSNLHKIKTFFNDN